MNRTHANAKTRLVTTPSDLGQISSERRKQFGISRRKAAPLAGVGGRFLAEFENGKPTAELGKVVNALHAAGLDLAVVERDQTEYGLAPATQQLQPLSVRVGTDFPYDWSNASIDEAVFIRKVLEAARYNDLLRTIDYFGYQRVAEEIGCLKDTTIANKVIGMLTRIQTGMLQALCQAATKDVEHAVS